MNDAELGPTLSSSLGEWEVELASREEIIIWAHGMRQKDEVVIFVALAEGSPRLFIHVARTPAELVKTTYGG